MKIDVKNGITHLSGVMDEHAEFSPLLKSREPLRINFSGISRTNSTGVRGFLKFLRDWNDRQLEYLECTSELMYQFTVVSGMLGTQNQAKIVTFMGMFECAKCEAEHDIPLSVTEVDGIRGGAPAPTKPCPNCSTSMVFNLPGVENILRR